MKRLSMLKLSTIAALLSSSLFGNSIDKAVTKYETQRIKSVVKRAHGKVNEIKIVLKKDLKKDGWYGYVFNIDVVIKSKHIIEKDSLFAKDGLISPELINTKTKRSYKDILYPKITKKYYNKEHLIAGNPNAKHKLVLFSDPLCPICVDEVPFIIKNIIDNPKNIALYYYHLPLDMHPTSKTVSIAAMIAKKQGIKNIDYKVYNTNLSEKYKFNAYREKNKQKVLDFFNKEFNTKITMKQINNKKYSNKLAYDLKMSEDVFVQGTPTVFFDGNIDKQRVVYEKYLK